MTCRSRSCRLVYLLAIGARRPIGPRRSLPHREQHLFGQGVQAGQPQHDNLWAGLVYDYLDDKTVAVFDRPRVRFLLLDPGRKVKTEVSTEKLQRFCDDLQSHAATEGNAYLNFWPARTSIQRRRQDGRIGNEEHAPHLSRDHAARRQSGSRREYPRVLGLVRSPERDDRSLPVCFHPDGAERRNLQPRQNRRRSPARFRRKLRTWGGAQTCGASTRSAGGC